MASVGAYLRISSDPYGQEAGVDRQREDAHRIAATHGWTVAEEYVDNDLSAYKRGVVRPAFERMLRDLRERRIDGLVFWHLDRFTRQPIELEQLIHLHDDLGGLLCAHAEGRIDLGSSSTRLMARISMAVANESSAATGRRTSRMHAALAQQGKPVGGTRPFGWQADKIQLEPVEAELLRKAAADVAGGKALRQVVREWTDAGVTTTRGNPWRASALRSTLLSPRLRGLRTHRGTVTLDAAGRPVRGLWTPLLSESEHAAVCAVLEARTGSQGSRPSRRVYLLSGVARCAECLAPMYGSSHGRAGKPYHYYRCPGTGTGRGCGKVSIGGPPLDEMVWEAVLRVAGTETAEADVAWPMAAELADAEQRAGMLWDAWRAKRLTGPAAIAALEEAEAEVTQLREQREQHERQNALAPAEAVSLAGADPTVDQRRLLVRRVFKAVLVRPQPAGSGRRFEPSRVEPVTWR